MKPFLLVLLAAALAGCAGFPAATREGEAERLGWIERSALAAPPYGWFRATYDTVRTAPEFLELIGAVHEGTDVTVVFGGWCPDSRREVPKFLKVLDSAGVAPERVRLYVVDRTKKGNDSSAAVWGIERVPTFIFFRGGREVGRIVESPETTMEGDVLALFNRARAQ